MGSPQRRRRIFLVADFGGHSAGEILFESESVWRHYQESREQRQKAAANLGGGTLTSGTGADIVCLMDQGGQRMMCTGTLSVHFWHTVQAHRPLSWRAVRANAEIGIAVLSDHYSSGRDGRRITSRSCLTITDRTPHSGPVKVAQTITPHWDDGGNNTPLAVHGEPCRIAGNVINRQDKTGEWLRLSAGVSYTLTTETAPCVYG
ncbi:MAG: hypothetical protein ACLU6P_09470 [Roseburia intestinalis]